MDAMVVTIIGRVGNVEELKYTSSGNAVLSFTVAVSIGKKKQDGTYDNITHWVKVETWGALGEGVSKGLRKGMPVTVVGKVRDVQNFTRRDGTAGSQIVVSADVIQYPNTQQSNTQPQQAATASQQAPTSSKDPQGVEYGEDIPF